MNIKLSVISYRCTKDVVQILFDIQECPWCHILNEYFGKVLINYFCKKNYSNIAGIGLV